MQFLPVVQRELLVAARQRSTYLSRTASAGILLAFFGGLLKFQASNRGFTGGHILQFLSALVFFESMLAGVRYTSDCLSEEKREGTLGLLFLTDLRGFDIVLGKLVARSIGAIFNLVAVIPILALTVLVGGVVGAQITSLSLTLLLVILFSLSAGAFISSRGYRERTVLLSALTFLVIITFLPIALNEIAIRVFRYYGFSDTLQLLSPLFAFREAGRGFTPLLESSFWTLGLLSVVFLAYASWRIRHAFGEPEPLAPKAANPMSPGGRRFSLRPSSNPILWLALRSSTRGSRVFFFCAFAVTFGIFARMAIENKWNWAPPIVLLTSYGLHALYKFLVTAETCRQLIEDKQSGALELLLTTPVPGRQVVRAHITATRKTWLPAAISVGFMNFLWMGRTLFKATRFGFCSRAAWSCCCPTRMRCAGARC